MNQWQRRQALLDAFDKYEKMNVLLSCLARSPAVWGDDEDDGEVSDWLVEEGLLKEEAGFFTTTNEGREALIAYINGEDEA